uniref:Uncharacterized protein n=1 Tax=Musa acuminata subsp. malaccensis TaxID=214687 RepID=A0A804HUB3_MUSAM
MAPEPEDDTSEKNPRPLDEDDIALLKTYVSCPSSAASPSSSFPLFDLSSKLLFPLLSSLGVQDRVVRRFFIKNQGLFLFTLSFFISRRIFGSLFAASFLLSGPRSILLSVFLQEVLELFAVRCD